MNISNNVSSIQAHQTFLNTNANNIANVNSDGFIPKDTRLEDKKGSVTASTVKADDSGSTKSQTNLAKEIPDQISIQAGVSANVEAIKTQDDVLGSLLDIKA